jgi:hypothetical protein
MKLKLKLKNNVNIILLIGLFILSGVLLLYKRKIIEGANGDDAADEEEDKQYESDSEEVDTDKATELADQLPGDFEKAGVKMNASFADVQKFLRSLRKGFKKEVAATAAAKDARDGEAYNTPVENTVAPIFRSNTFFTGNKFSDAFCSINGGNPSNLSNQCATLTSDNCNATDCCVWVNGSKCMAGDANGPSIPSGTTGNVDADYYSYRYQCYGECDS